MNLSRRAFVTGGTIGASLALASDAEAYIGFLHKSGIGQVIAPIVNAAQPTVTPTAFMTTAYSGRRPNGPGTGAPDANPNQIGDPAINSEIVVGNFDNHDMMLVPPGGTLDIYAAAGNADIVTQQNIASATMRIGDGITFVSASTSTQTQSPSKWTYGLGFRMQAPTVAQQPTLASAPLYVDAHGYLTPANGLELKPATRRVKIVQANPSVVFASNAPGVGAVTTSSMTLSAFAAAGAAATGTISAATLYARQPITRPSGVVPLASVLAATAYAGQKGINYVIYDDATGQNARIVNRNVAAKGFITTSTSGGVATCTVQNGTQTAQDQFDTLIPGMTITIGSALLTIQAVTTQHSFTATAPNGFVDVTAVEFNYQFTFALSTVYLEDTSYLGFSALNYEPVEIWRQSGAIGYQGAGISRNYPGAIDVGTGLTFTWPVTRLVVRDTYIDFNDTAGNVVIQSLAVNSGSQPFNKVHRYVNCGLFDHSMDNDVATVAGGGNDGIIDKPLLIPEPGYIGFDNCVGQITSAACNQFSTGTRFSGCWDINYWTPDQTQIFNFGQYVDISNYYYDHYYAPKNKIIDSVARDTVYGRTAIVCAKDRHPAVALLLSSVTGGNGTQLSAVALLNDYAQDSNGNYLNYRPHGFSLYAGTSGLTAYNIAFDNAPLAGKSVVDDFSVATGFNVAARTDQNYAVGTYVRDNSKQPCVFLINTTGSGLADMAPSAAPVRLGGFYYNSCSAGGGEILPNTYSTPCFIRACAADSSKVFKFSRNDFIQGTAPPNDLAYTPSFNGSGGDPSNGFMLYMGVSGGAGSPRSRGAGVNPPGSTVNLANFAIANKAYGGPGVRRAAAPVTISGNTVTARGVNGTDQSGSPTTTISSSIDANGVLIICSGALPAATVNGLPAFGHGCTIRDQATDAILGYVAANNGNVSGYSLSGTAKFYLQLPPGQTLANFAGFSSKAWTWSWDDPQVWQNCLVGINTATGQTPSIADVVAVQGNVLTTNTNLGDTTTPVTLSVYYSRTSLQVNVFENYYNIYGQPQNPASYALAKNDLVQPVQREHNDVWQAQYGAYTNRPPITNVVMASTTIVGDNIQPMQYALNGQTVPGTAAFDGTAVVQLTVPSLTFSSITYQNPLSANNNSNGKVLNGLIPPDFNGTAKNASAWTNHNVFTIVMTGSISLTGAVAGYVDAVGNMRLGITGGTYTGKTLKIFNYSVSGTTLTLNVVDDLGIFGGSTAPSFTSTDTFLQPIPLFTGTAVCVGNLGSSQTLSDFGEIRAVRSVDAVAGTVTLDRPWIKYANTSGNVLTIVDGMAQVLFQNVLVGIYENNLTRYVPGTLGNQPDSPGGQNFFGAVVNWIYDQCSMGMSPGGSAGMTFTNNTVCSMSFKNSILGGSWIRASTKVAGAGANEWFDGAACKQDNCQWGSMSYSNGVATVKPFSQVTGTGSQTATGPGNSNTRSVVNTDGNLRPYNVYAVPAGAPKPLAGNLLTMRPRHGKAADGQILATDGSLPYYVGALQPVAGTP